MRPCNTACERSERFGIEEIDDEQTRVPAWATDCAGVRVLRGAPGDDALTHDRATLRWYLIGSGLFLLPGGIQIVLLPWLVAVLLHESPVRVGVAQMAGQLPMLLLLIGGVLGDRFDQRRLLLSLHCLIAVPSLVMAVLVGAGGIRFEAVLIFALSAGLMAALAQPARDALLSSVAGDDVQRGVTFAIGVQIGVQILGFGVGAGADWVGARTLLLLQVASYLLGALAIARVRVPARSSAARRGALREIGEGLALSLRDGAIRPALLLTLAVGVFFAGTFMVVLPLMVRDLYGGGSLGLAGAFAANLAGTAATIGIYLRVGPLRWPGRALALGIAVSAVVLAALALPLPVAAFYAVVFLWGASGGVAIITSRGIVQEAAPESHRARVMSVYGLALLGGMPLGSVGLGWAVGALGARTAVLIPALGMLAAVLIVALTTRLWRIESGSGRLEV